MIISDSLRVSQLDDCLHKILANSTAHTPTCKFNLLLGRGRDQVSIKPYRPKLIDHKSYCEMLELCKKVIKQGRLTSSEKSGDNRDRSFMHLRLME